MQRKTLILLTHNFPNQIGEEFLIDEIETVSLYFDKILIVPVNSKLSEFSLYDLPRNVEVQALNPSLKANSNPQMFKEILKLLFNEFFRMSNKRLFFATLKFNLALLKQCYLKALFVKSLINIPKQTIVYAYWTDDLATIAGFTKALTPEISFVSRAHGFDVFEEQSKFKHIFFRSFQLDKINKLFSVSEVGANHLKLKNKTYAKRIGCSYLGIKSDAQFAYDNSACIRLVTCSRIRSIKRLELLVEALKLIEQTVEWEVIGDGEDLEKLKALTKSLPANIKVNFHGNMTTHQIHEFYASKHFDFLVSLSSSEGLPVSMMEAISHGIPILSTDVGGCKEIVTEVTGLLIPATFQLEQLAQLIKNCKLNAFNSIKNRQQIIQFWESKFKSEINYKQFAETILQL
jgi:glycosyltransferase involved in cell wall biosynthesis